jgi:hypothetical protein
MKNRARKIINLPQQIPCRFRPVASPAYLQPAALEGIYLKNF